MGDGLNCYTLASNEFSVPDTVLCSPEILKKICSVS